MLKTIKVFAYIDLLLGIVLAMPFVGVLVIDLLQSIVSNEVLLINDYHAFLMKILGVMVVLWAMVRLQHTALWQIQYDCIARLVVLGYMSYYCYNGLNVLIFFIIIELLGLYQWMAQKQNSKES